MVSDRMRALAACALGCFLAACSPSGPRVPTPVRIATFNAHDLFDDRPDGEEAVVDTASYASHLQAVGLVLQAVDADIVVLQEVENLRVLQALAASAGYPETVLVPGNDPRGINLGVLSRLTFDAVISHKNDLFPGADGMHRYARDCLELHRAIGGRDLVLLAVHLKSKAVPDDPDKRLAEARHTRAIADAVTAVDPAAAVLVLGDMNDVPGSPPLIALEGRPPDAYVDVASATADAWTYDFRGAPQLLDHQMVSPVLRPMLDFRSVTILHGPTVEHASDHAPLAATYRID
jgi:endonuclease/exonuclease/phosphatase family metal-dependent hydrolase